MDDSTATVPDSSASSPADLPPLLAAARVNAPKHRWAAIAAAHAAQTRLAGVLDTVDFSTAEPAPASRVGWGDSPATA